MSMQKNLLVFYAHPDDEVLGLGGTLAKYASQGIYAELVCATRGEAGEISDPTLATPETLGIVREAELRCSARTLGIQTVTFLEYRDSGMAGTAENQNPAAFINAPTERVVPQLVQIIRRVKPYAIFTFEPHGGYGHPDHIAINRHTLTAIPAAADPAYHPEQGQPWQTPRLFYPILRGTFFAEMKILMEAYGMDTSFFTTIEERRANGWPDHLYHYELDVADTVEAKWAAFHCHHTQFGSENLFRRLPEAEMKRLISREYFAQALPEPIEGQVLRDLLAV